MLTVGHRWNSSSSLNSSSLSEAEKLDVLRKLNDEAAYNLLPVFIVCGILMLIGIVGNSLVVYVYWAKMRHSAKNTFILALAWLDLSVCIVCIPCEMYDLRNQVLFSQNEFCKGMRFLEYSTVLSAGFVLISISFERYYYLCKAFEEFSSRKAKFVCLACVGCAMFVSTPSAIFAGSKMRHFPGYAKLTGYECSLNSEHNFDEIFKRIYYYLLFLLFFGCVVVFIVIYSMIGRLLWKYQSGRMDPVNIETNSSGNANKHSSNWSLNYANQVISLDTSSGQERSSKTECMSQSCCKLRRRVRSAGTVIVFFSVTVVFVLSFLPHLVMRFIKFLDLQPDHDKDTFDLMYNLFVRSYFISNAANPFIYSIMNKGFRKELTTTLRKCRLLTRGTTLR